MERLAVYLPPFASDYSGVCSALYELNCLIIIDDASCCTRNYVTYDEPRWTESTRSTFGSNLRTIEAVLGDEERLISQTIEAAEKLKPEFIALLGSPVPAIIGRDMKGIAREIEARSGFAALGFDTTGFSYYNKGISAAHLQLLQRFAVPGIPTAAGHVNILGLTPLDFSANDNSRDLIRLLEDNGFRVNVSFWMQTGLDQVRRAPAAKVNLVVSQSGWAAAQYLYKSYGIPYVAAAPLGIRHSRMVLEALGQTMADKQNRIIKDAKTGTGAAWLAAGEDGAWPAAGTGALLIIGDQVMANSLRAALRQADCRQDITVASFFDLEPELALPGDLLLKSEKQLIKLLRSGAYTRLMADPLILSIPAAAGLKGHSLPHPAISSLLHWQDVPLFLGEEFEKLILSWSDGN
ncbi:Nitrogenase molybdenum-iron protein, alpha and beta chains [Desulfitobacterium sp. LBE]|uniref:Oxidoreductase/nitrogenase component 1 n=1 Tax=Desulfitobacterium hafniense TaxID=49338 RepID=A0A098B6L8_DESHA|nr:MULTISPECIES: nitrogenase component 1 [Desulfitobacterium]TWH57557.1 Nitrogenase molybdenum-iron protein, alpha and beta chains [Desulfitobacterium sp. LBE]CDX04020.1 Oxidoreductase/nitrogenase component 1 [Desulfitobacterium hafniense]